MNSFETEILNKIETIINLLFNFYCHVIIKLLYLLQQLHFHIKIKLEHILSLIPKAFYIVFTLAYFSFVRILKKIQIVW